MGFLNFLPIYFKCSVIYYLNTYQGVFGKESELPDYCQKLNLDGL